MAKIAVGVTSLFYIGVTSLKREVTSLKREVTPIKKGR
jgi:hypothetical protein